MHPRSSNIFALIVFATGAWMVTSGFAAAQTTAAAAHPIPQSLQVEHDEIPRQRLTLLSKRSGQVGVVAHKALDVFKRHIARGAGVHFATADLAAPFGRRNGYSGHGLGCRDGRPGQSGTRAEYSRSILR